MLSINADSSEEEITEWLFSIGREAIKPAVELTVSEWADQYRILAKGTAEPGPWRTDRTPYLRDIMDALGPDSPYEYIVFMKGAQIGATEAGINWIGFVIHYCAAAMMVVWPTIEDIKSNVAIRIKPFFDSTPCVGERIGDGNGPRDGGNNTMMKVFPGGFLAFAASNSTAQLRSKPIRFMFPDELDEYPHNANQQGDPLALAEARTRSFGSRKKIYTPSTPTIEGASKIEALFNATDMRRYYVPCPLCGAYQSLVWEYMRWETSRPAAPWYECAICAGRIEEFQKVTMLARGEWRPESESSDPKRIGFHLSALYAPFGMFSWAEAVAGFLAAAGDPTKLQVWTNTVLGLPFAQKGERPEWEKLYARRNEHELGSVPEAVCFLTAGIDVQKDRIEAEVVGWGRGKESWSIHYYVFPGDTANLQSEAWNGLRELLSAGFIHATGAVLQIHCAAIDSGYNTNVVYNFAREYEAPKLVVIKGEDSLTHILGTPKKVDLVTASGKKVKRGPLKYPVGVSVLKHELYGWLRLEHQDGAAQAPGYCHFPDFGEEFFKQLTAESWVTWESRSTKKTHGEWRKTRERNEALDCRIYARAAAAIARIDTFKGPDWDRLEMAVGSRKEPEYPPASAAGPAGPAPSPERRRRYRSKGKSQ